MKVGDRVRIVEDEYPELVGLVGKIEQISRDNTSAWVVRYIKKQPFGVWCSISSLEVCEEQQ